MSGVLGKWEAWNASGAERVAVGFRDWRIQRCEEAYEVGVSRRWRT